MINRQYQQISPCPCCCGVFSDESVAIMRLIMIIWYDGEEEGIIIIFDTSAHDEWRPGETEITQYQIRQTLSKPASQSASFISSKSWGSDCKYWFDPAQHVVALISFLWNINWSVSMKDPGSQGCIDLMAIIRQPGLCDWNHNQFQCIEKEVCDNSKDIIKIWLFYSQWKFHNPSIQYHDIATLAGSLCRKHQLNI